MPENQPVLGAPAHPPAPAADAPVPPPGLPPLYPPPRPTLWQRVSEVADAVGTSPVRLVVGGMVGAVLVLVLAWMLAAAPPAPSAAASSDAALPRASSQAAPPGASTATSTGAGPTVVYVAGAVVRPGLYRLGADARVADALDAAGGLQPDADMVQLNLAAPVADGERVYVPRKGEAPVGEPSGAPGVLSSSGAVRPTPVNLNTATLEQLDALPGIGPSTAQAIIEWRRQHGRFRKVDDLLNVRGIGLAKLEALRKQVRV